MHLGRPRWISTINLTLGGRLSAVGRRKLAREQRRFGRWGQHSAVDYRGVSHRAPFSHEVRLGHRAIDDDSCNEPKRYRHSERERAALQFGHHDRDRRPAWGELAYRVSGCPHPTAPDFVDLLGF